MNVEDIIRTHIRFHLTQGFKEWQWLDIANSSADFSDDDIWVSRCCSTFDFFFQGICDMWDNLNRRSQIFAFTLFTQNFWVDFTRRYVRVFIEVHIHETLIVTQVKVSFCAIICHINFSMLVRTHCPWIDIDVRIKLLNGDFKATIFQKTTKTWRHNPFTNTWNHTTCDENILCHLPIISLF